MRRSDNERAEYRGQALALRGLLGGTLMGLANLVPGISGGTMLLASGVYSHFINGVAEVSTFRFKPRTIFILGCIVCAAAVSIILLAGPVSELVTHHRWVMYALFIGLTLGGVPALWHLIGKLDARVTAMTLVGIVLMACMAFMPPGEVAMPGDASRPYLMYFVAGVAGATAMVLPGVSGGYLLLILGQYVTILTAIATAKDGVKSGDWQQLGESMHVIVPVGLGVLTGVIGVSNIVKILLARFRRATLGLLLGLLLGAVLGLWPFREGVPPEVGTPFRGDVVALQDGELIMKKSGLSIEIKHYPTERFAPTGGQMAGAVVLVLTGFAASFGIAMIGRGAEDGD